MGDTCSLSSNSIMFVQVYFQRVLSSKTASYAQNLSFIAGIGCIIMVIPPALLGAVAFSTGLNTVVVVVVVVGVVVVVVVAL